MIRTITWIFMFVYTISTSGFRAQLHYCGGELDSITFFGENPDCGCGDEEAEEEGCCEDEQHYFKLNTDHSTTKTIQVDDSPALVLNSSGFSLPTQVQFQDGKIPEAQSQPPPGKYRKHVMICRWTC